MSGETIKIWIFTIEKLTQSFNYGYDNEEIKNDYDFIREKLVETGFESLTGKDGKWIQARTKGPGHGSTSRAFYARKELVEKIFELAN
ncbi:hypothetical protein COU05_04010 [bacterium (Candidatus Gribaldobacteria) CG10_big_fil_rev_8_21_14_0_10_37_21]|uniref:Uncharacterized protein n=1 Tax=bacterium (Candidatus Gribaldobacteria) CG10_big_fil_rev_8_21_14_0_10_37_21 TaxID=2014275 RepID=A0A2H0UT97_9BACT|nr:MAG: hypothetical protein COU05_04010 [bacterium (Candidatus Gribaldobacteria) CG10_big_fil_rev_8_21_14_0_10_37_21]